MKKKIIGIFVCTLVLATALPAVGTLNNSLKGESLVDKPLDGGWTKTFGGSDWDFGDCVQQTSDGGYIITADTKSYGAGGLDIWLIKTDADGVEEWNKTFGGSALDWPDFILQTIDGGFIISGETYSYGAGGSDAWLIKTDTDGNKIWDKTYGGTGFERARTVWNTTDGGYIIGGSTSSFGAGDSDYWLIKTDSNGIEQWNKTFGGTGPDDCWAMRPVDGGYILVGFVLPTKIFDKAYCWLVKTDADGNKLWDKKIEGTRWSAGWDIRQTSDGGYIISGETNGFGFWAGSLQFNFGGDMWLVKTDADGNKIWDKSFGRRILEDSGMCVELTDDGGYIIGGNTKGFGNMLSPIPPLPFSKIWVVKTDADGNKIWDKEFSRGICWSIRQTSDGGHIVTGGGTKKLLGQSDVFFIKID